jgi:hypothetical protein
MFNWLRRIDDAVFAPPHRFETILAFVVLRLGLVFESDRDESTEPETKSQPPQPRSHRLS